MQTPPRQPRTGAPSPWVVRFAPLVPRCDSPDGWVLDLAAGGGRHARLFLDLGHRVLALDRDLSDLGDLAGEARLELVVSDLEGDRPWRPGRRRFAGIVVTNYLWRPLLPLLPDWLAPGGVLIYETFARGNERFGRPHNPAHLLAPGELLEAVGDRLQVIAYEHGEVAAPRAGVVQRICAAKTAGPCRLTAL